MDSQSQSRINRNLKFRANDDEIVLQRLACLVAANSEIELRKRIFRSDDERSEAEMMVRPMESKEVFAWFGFLLGTLPPAVILFKLTWLFEPGDAGIHPVILVLMVLLNITTAVTGFFSGKVTAILVRKLEKSTPSRIALLAPLTGFAWGAACGFAGGIFMFIAGAYVGAVIGGFVGAVALPLFVLFHLLLKRGDLIDRRHFLPAAFGITLTICALVLGW